MRFILIILLVVSSNLLAQDRFITDYWDLNSAADEQAPILSADGKTLFFTRAHHPENIGGKSDKGDIWFSQFSTSSGWSLPERLDGSLNTNYYNAAFAYFQNELYLYTDYRSNSRPAPGVSKVALNEWPRQWSTPSNIIIKYFSTKSVNTGNALSADGKIMLLSLESFKTRGAEDIYVSFYNEQLKEWSEPKNLGDNINTKLQELTPSLAPDNRTLFFSSNGHGGEGSRDVFVSQRLDESWTNWSEVRNLGTTVNTSGAEMGYRFYPEHELAVYTTTTDSDGYGDIRVVPVTTDELNQILTEEIIVPMDIADLEEPINNMPVEESENTLTISGKISDFTSSEAVFAKTKLLGPDGFMVEHFNDTTFNFTVLNERNYVLQVEAEGYFSKQLELNISTNDSKLIVQNVEIEKIVVGAKIVLKNVLFKRGETEFIGSSLDELDLVAEMMRNNPTMQITLSGHTDAVGNAQLNLRLSQERVDAVINYLVEKEIDSSRLSGTGYGGTVPLASNATESTRKLNRRVEFTIVSQ